jgi:hypothetical protein
MKSLITVLVVAAVLVIILFAMAVRTGPPLRPFRDEQEDAGS